MKIQTRKSQDGFTLVELITGLAVAAILCAVSFPALGGLVHATQSRAAQDVMLHSLNLARNASVAAHGEVAICPSRDQRTCDGGMWWQGGWIVFRDTDGDGRRDENEALLEVVQPQSGVVIVSSEHRTHVTYRSDGTSIGTNATITFCDRKTLRSAGSVVINNVGRARQAAASPDQDATCHQTDPQA